MWIWAILNLICIFIIQRSTTDLSSTIPRCHLDDEKMNECLLQATIDLKPLIKNGIEELGIPPYEPRNIPYLSGKHDSNLAHFEIEIHNFTIRGMENYDVTDLRYDPKSMEFSGSLEFDSLSVGGIYSLNGTVISIRLRGYGSGHAAMGPITATFKIAGKMKKLNNIDYYDQTGARLNLTIDDISIYLNDLFDGNPELGAATNYLINRNSKLFVSAATPVMEKWSEEFLKRYVKWLTGKYPYYQLFPRSQEQVEQLL